MSHFYGTLKGSRGEAMRCGSRGSGMVSYTASWRGAVRVSLRYDEEMGKDQADVRLVPWHGAGTDRVLYQGPVGGERDDALKQDVKVAVLRSDLGMLSHTLRVKGDVGGAINQVDSLLEHCKPVGG